MKYYIAADGGGSKLQTILYDEELNIIGTAKTNGVNTYFKSVELIKKEIEQMIETLIPKSVETLERADISVLGSSEIFIEALKRKCPPKKYNVYTEGHTALAAAGEKYGIAVQSGTGSDAVIVFENGIDYDYVGGWGALLGDEGSGYDIGLKSLKAAIYAYDGRGKNTIMLNMIKDKWNIGEMSELITKLSDDPEYRKMIASVTYITSEAARLGDKVAIGIYEQAAYEMALQAKAVIKKYNCPTWPIVISGGTWKGSEKMAEAFTAQIKDEYPQAFIKRAIFEPVIGCIILRCFDEGMEFVEIENILNEKYKEFKL